MSSESTTPGDPSHHTSLRHSLLGPSLLKAGQDRVDQEKVGEVIYNASKGSKFFKYEEKRDQQLTHRIELILRRKKHLEMLDLSSHIKRVDEQISALEAQRDLSQCIVHVDCDAFFASVEELDRPELKEVPMAVGGGVLTTCNYKAREFGVRSGMAGYIAKQLCPQLIFLPLNFHKYAAKAEEVRQVLVKYDERYEAASIDEAFLNITSYVKSHEEMTPDDVVAQIRNEVLSETKVSISAGIAPNAMRILSDREAIMSFMSDLPVRKVNGIGRVFERELSAVGIKTFGDVLPLRGILSRLFSEKSWSFLLRCHLGLGRTEIHPVEEYERKSIGTERTFRDLSGATELRGKLQATAQDLEKALYSAQLAGRTVVLKVKLHSFEVHSRQRAMHRAISSAEDLYNCSLPLLSELEAEFKPLKVRLMGLRLTQLVEMRETPGRLDDFFRNAPSSPAKRKRKQLIGGDGWEVWPEEELEGSSLSAKDDKEEGGSGHLIEAGGGGDAYSTEPIRESGTISPGDKGSEVDTRWECPVCTRSLPADDAIFNEHVDFCLSRATIREFVQESTVSPEGSGKKQLGRKRRCTTPRAGRAGSSENMDRYFLRSV